MQLLVYGVEVSVAMEGYQVWDCKTALPDVC